MLCSKIVLSLAAVLTLVSCTYSASEAPVPAQGTIPAVQIYPAVEQFVDKDNGVVCYIKRTEYYRQSDSISCVKL